MTSSDTYTNGRRADNYKVVGTKRRPDGSQMFYVGNGGTRLIKTVDYTTVVCSECRDSETGKRVAAWKDEKEDAICPMCGMVCGEDEKRVWPSELSHGTSQVNDDTRWHDFVEDENATEVADV